MTNATIIIPVAPYHTELVSRALDSVASQTVSCAVLSEVDHDKRGPAYIRNKLLAQVETPMVVFLDADDWIEPEYVAQCMAVLEPGRYVYTDWLSQQTIHKSPSKPWCGGTWHPVTTLLWTHDVRSIGGFDETLPSMEDLDFYLKLTTTGHCGTHLELPLFHYGLEGQRALQSRLSGEELRVKKIIKKRHGGKMGCCGDQEAMSNIPLGTRQPGDVLAMALWGGNRKEYGRATGRRYERMSMPKTTWVHPRDIEAKPEHWQPVSTQAVDDPYRFQSMGDFADGVTGGKPKPKAPEADTPFIPAALPEGGFNPDVSHIVKVAQTKLAT